MDSSKALNKDFVKKDISLNFKFQVWFIKVHFLHDNHVDYILEELELVITEESTQEEKIKQKKWKQDNYSTRSLILNAMEDMFSLQFHKESSAKKNKIWDTVTNKF